MSAPATTLAVGARFEGPARHFTLARLRAFSGGPLANPDWPARNLHTDEAKAREAGLAAPIASGIQYQAHLVALLGEVFGETWRRGGRLHTKYPKVVVAGDAVRPVAVIAAVAPDAGATLYTLDVWCENQKQEKVLVGTARCMVPG